MAEEDRNYDGPDRRQSVSDSLLMAERLVHTTDLLIEQFSDNKKILSSLQSDITDLRLEIKSEISDLKENLTIARVDYKSFLKSYDRQLLSCIKIHDDHESRLREADHPACQNGKRLDALENENKDQNKTIYKIAGTMTVGISLVMMFLQWGIKHLK